MADNQAATTEMVKSYDISKGGYVEKPASEVDITNPDGVSKYRELPEDNTNEPDPTPTPEPKTETPATETTPTTTDPAPAKADESKPADETKPFEPGAYISEKWGKYGLKTEEDVENTIKVQKELIEKHNLLKTEHEKLKSEPKFRTEQEQKIADFLKDFDPSRFGEGLNTVASIMAMDPAQAAENDVLMEAYILRHPDLTREEAKELFKEEVQSQYHLDRENFDSEDEYNQKKRILDIKKKNQVAQDRKELTDKKAALKAAEPKTTPTTTPEKPWSPAPEVVQDYTKQVETFLKPAENKIFDRINYSSPTTKEPIFSLVIDQAKLQDVQEFMTDYVKNSSSYTKDGKIPNFAPEVLARTALRLLHGDWMEMELLKQVEVLAGKMKAEQIAGTSPEKKSSGTGDAKLSVDDQWKVLAQKEKERRIRR